MHSPKVSVLVTFYNQEKYVDKALQSIFMQKTNFDYQVLVGDDGSSDNTCGLVGKWLEKYPDRIELHVMDRGTDKYIPGFRASRNRLNLLRYVKGEYFIFLDGDDYFEYEYKLQKQVDILDLSENKDCIACGHNVDMLFPDGSRSPITSVKLKEGKYSPEAYWDNIYFHTDTLLARASVISTIPVRRIENNFNDNMITFTLIQNGSIYYIPESWVVYLQTGDGIWTSNKEVINHIRNMFLYDLCNQINPDMKKETSHRFAITWLSLLKIRRRISSLELTQYSEEAQNKNLEVSYKWIHYAEQKPIDKMLLCMEAVRKSWKIVIRLLLGKLRHYNDLIN